MEWPLLVDSINRLGLKAVPITVLLDEYGIVRAINPSREEFRRLMDRRFPPPPSIPDPAAALAGESAPADTTPRTALDWVRLGDLRLLWGDRPDATGPHSSAPSPGRAIEAYERAWALAPDAGAIAFRLGVAHRQRHDSGDRQPGDFAAAVRWWSRALALDPNQYIWRRRLQQYGPRLDKPYPFYDWVPEAREAIRRRGETPRPLVVEPGGAEFAHPQKQFQPGPDPGREPDPEGRIERDQAGWIQAETAVVPPQIHPGGVARVHVILRPNPAAGAHWNNEAEPLQLWVQPPPDWRVDLQRIEAPQPAAAVSDEVRHLEFELRAPPTASPGPVRFSAYALYYVCGGPEGTCVYRRLDVPIALEVTRP